MILYHPAFNKHSGSINATIWFLQVCYWYNKMERPFYKYDQPCDLTDYQMGHSWTEELGMTKGELKSAKQKGGSLLKKGKTYNGEDLSLILYWRSFGNHTYYTPNLYQLFKIEESKLLEKHFPLFRRLKSTFRKLENNLSEFHFLPPRKPDLAFPYIQYSTQEKTIKEPVIKPSFNSLKDNSLKKEKTFRYDQNKPSYNTEDYPDFNELFPKSTD